VPAKDLRLGDSHVYVASCPDRRIPMEQIARHAHQVYEKDICHAVTFASEALALSYGAHFCQVEVNTETGAIKVSDYVAVHDIGKPVNPMNVEGQIEGAIQMGLGFALSESLGIDQATGKCKNLTLRRYQMKYAHEMPDITVRIVGKAEESGPFGAKSLGECSTVPVAAAIANAVSNALGLEFDELPITPDVVLAKLEAAKKIKAAVPAG
jgi:CO/xanthine dehydrogenase Mo-binding subunit